MNLGDLFNALEKLLPILGTLSGHPELAALAQKLIDIGEKEIDRRMSEDPNLTRTQTLQAARRDYAEAKLENEKLKRLGHDENE